MSFLFNCPWCLLWALGYFYFYFYLKLALTLIMMFYVAFLQWVIPEKA